MRTIRMLASLATGLLLMLTWASAGRFPASVGLRARQPADWLASVQDSIDRSEYAVTWQDRTSLPDLPAAYQAPNRAQNLRTYFTRQGIRVVPRTGGSAHWEWGLTLTSYGSPRITIPVSPATLVVEGNRVEYHRGEITEWYMNDERGLEQGFTLSAPPPGTRGGAIHLDLAVSGTLVAAAQADSVQFQTPDGAAVLQLSDLHASDASGRRLNAEISVHAASRTGLRVLRLAVDARGAVYPIAIDPLVTSPKWTAESNQGFEFFGISVATAGDVNGDGYSDVIVGAYQYDNGQGEEGRAFVYHGSAAGLSATANWTGESNQALAYFGISVATAGDVNGDGYGDVIVGAYQYDNGQTDEGRAFVYHGSAVGLSAAANWTGESNQAGALYGISVATAGDVNGDGYSDVIVGASGYDSGEMNEGRAFVYRGSAAGLSATATWTGESNQADAFYGISVAAAGDVNGDGYSDVIVGAYAYDNGFLNEGRAFVYHGSAAGLRTPATANWTSESDQAGALYGISVAAAGDVNGDGYSDVIVGASQYDSGQDGEGRAFVYQGSAAGLSATANWIRESNQAGARYGISVATAGDVNGDGYSDVIVGASDYDNGQDGEGRAFVYQGSAAGLSGAAIWTGESNQVGAFFGIAVATAGDVNGDGYSDVIVGAHGYDNGQTNEGRAYVYYGVSSSLSDAPAWVGEANQSGASLGISVGTAGDVNGDGLADLIVGADHYDNGEADEGRAFVYYGTPLGPSTIPSWTAEGNQVGAAFGVAVGWAGDVNGDGYDDVIVGANGYDSGEQDEGAAFVFLGSPAGLNSSPGWIGQIDQTGAAFGTSVGRAGDVNGDGYGDVIVGGYKYDVRIKDPGGRVPGIIILPDAGAVQVFHGSATGLSAAANWAAGGGQNYGHLGISVATAGDVNRDGYSDVIVGAWLEDNGQADEGRAYVFHGSSSGLSGAANWTGEENQAGAQYGRSVAAAGDVNGDGYSDVIVGAPNFNNGQSAEGVAFTYHGSPAGLSPSFIRLLQSNQSGALFGFSVASAGDVNGDGYADVAVGAPRYANPLAEEGAAFVYHGSSSALGVATSPKWRGEGNQSGAFYGVAVSAAGDLNGDGYGDLVVGAFLLTNGSSNEGAAFFYYGNGGRGIDHRPRLRRSSNAAPVAHLGMSDSIMAIRLAARGRTPYGRSRVKLQWEIRPLGTAFSGVPTGESGWVNTGTAGQGINQLVAGLSPATNYHWRVRFRYDPARTPFQQYGRWLTMPWNGWNEKDFRTP